MNAKTCTLYYRLVSDFAGVRNNRALSAFERFADANRAAMAACGEKRRAVRVFAFCGERIDLVAEYIVGPSGLPQAVAL